MSVSIIGTGVQGTAITKVLVAKGVRVTVWDIDAEELKNGVAAGGVAATNAADAAAASDFILIVTLGGTAVAICDEMKASLGTEKTVISMGAESSASMLAARDIVKMAGSQFAVAVLMSPRPAIAGGKGKMLFHGDFEGAAEKLGPILAPIGIIKPLPSIEAVGAMFAAMLTMAFNLCGGFSNGLAITTKAGLPPDAYLNFVAEGGPMFIEMMKGPTASKTLKGDFGDDGGSFMKSQVILAAIDEVSKEAKGLGCDPSMLQAFSAQVAKGQTVDGPKADGFTSMFKAAGGKYTSQAKNESV